MATMIIHDPAYCRCANCSVQRAMVEAGGWEWVDDGRSEADSIRPPGFGWLLLAAAVFVAVMAGTTICALTWL